ncbi:uncharacterized protein LOC143045765 [Mytilus galloprovincialis]|uniref:uncharacterized protein LOC143045765 n=1 Tax=Mytilus galloprovincialis TaxID=29158 RepID=UPI003F7C576D
MDFKMCFGLKIGCLCYILLFSHIVAISFAQQWTAPTFDLPVYGIYNRNVPSGATTNSKSNDVYWNGLAKAFEQNPEAIIQGIEDSREQIQNKKRLFRDQYGRQFLWDPISGAIPVFQNNHVKHDVQAIPIMYYDRVTGYLRGRQSHSKLQFLVPKEGYLLRRNRHQNVECDPTVHPMLSFDDGGETRDPCTGQAKSNKQAEFGLTTTSGMADVLCAFCQHIKNLRCIWQFCSHPDGVYKIKVSDNKG